MMTDDDNRLHEATSMVFFFPILQVKSETERDSKFPHFDDSFSIRIEPSRLRATVKSSIKTFLYFMNCRSSHASEISLFS